MTSSRTQYVYFPISGKSSEAKVSIGKPLIKLQSIVTENDSKNNIIKDKNDKDIPKIKKVGVEKSSKIRILREKLEMSQDEFSRHIGVTKNLITKYEKPGEIFVGLEYDIIMKKIDKLNTKSKN